MDFLGTKPHCQICEISNGQNAFLLEAWSALHFKTTVWKGCYFAEWLSQKRASVTLPKDTA